MTCDFVYYEYLQPQVEPLSWCELVALHMARKAGAVNSPAQENLFLCRWLATDEKRRLFRRELANDIRWLLKKGSEKGIRADLHGKLEYFWGASSGDLLAQNDLFRLQHILHAITLTGINYGALSETEWGRASCHCAQSKIPGMFLRKSDLQTGFDEQGGQIRPMAARITANTGAVDDLLSRAGCERTCDMTNPFYTI